VQRQSVCDVGSPRRLVARATMALALTAAGVQSASAQSFVLYDDFSSGGLSAARWIGEDGRSFGGIRLEARRAVLTGQLRIEMRGYGDNVDNAGNSSVRNALILPQSSAVTAMRSTVTMRATSFAACAANPGPTAARARMFGFFFNAGTPMIGSNLNDVFAGIQVARAANSTDPANTYRVQAFLGICTDDSCISSAPIDTTRDLGTVLINEPVMLSMAWNAASNNFSFQRDSQTAVTIPYVVKDAAPASFPSKRLEVSNNIAHCSPTRAGVYTAADFDNVMTNSLPAPLSGALFAPLMETLPTDGAFSAN
jgi:hypothetical protein